MPVKVELTRQMMEGMREFIKQAIDLPFDKNTANLLVRLMVKRIYKKLESRLEKEFPEGMKKKFSLKDEEALALHCWYQHTRNALPYQYPQIVLDGVFAKIDQHYA